MQAATISSGPPIDLDHLRRYTGGDIRLEHEILTLFIDQTPGALANMKAAPNVGEWRFIAHGLKGSARAVGAHAVADLTAVAEALDLTDDAARARCQAMLEAAVAQARAFIDAHVATATA